MEAWKHTKPAEEIKVGWRTLVRKTFEDPEGKEQEYVTLAKIGSICIATIALTPHNTVIVAEQFRPGPEKMMQELPGGGHEAGEALDGAARRELHEETGYVAGSMKHLGAVYKDAYSNSVWHFFLARDCVADSEQHTDDGEYVTVKEISITELFANARNGRMTDTEAVLLAYDKLKTIEEETHETTN